MKRALTLLAFASLVSLAAPAAADVVSPEPASCPAGSTPATCHGGPHCQPALCGTTADCDIGSICQDVSLCVKSISCGGLLPPDADPSDFLRDAVQGPCAGACSGGECKTLKVCIPGGMPTSSSSGSSSSGSTGGSETGGCACTTAAGAGPLGAAFAALAATAALAFARRRARR